mmetsp:Transcript_48013/g.114112  ORF Transcript_48013/g.114112 Transcript_48013/m.114112 type:complete len:631 (-) Transcript_48013:47-1939(-)
MIFCTQCGAQFAEDARFCSNCGAKRPPTGATSVSLPGVTPSFVAPQPASGLQLGGAFATPAAYSAVSGNQVDGITPYQPQGAPALHVVNPASLSATACAPAPAGVFDVLDKNHDGVITRAEFNEAAGLSSASRPSLPVYSRLFAQLDLDGDGKLSHEEMQAARQLLKGCGSVGPIIAACLEVADLDKDGFVSLQDWQTYTSRCDLGETVVQGLAELLQQLDSVPAGWMRLPLPNKPGQLGFYQKDLDIWATDAHLIESFPGKCRIFDNLLTKLGKMGKGVVAGLQFQAVCSTLRQQGGVGAFMAQHLQQADTNRDGLVDRQDWIRHFINVNVSDQELALIDEAIGLLDPTDLDELQLAGQQGGLPYGWEKQESSSRPGVFYYVHSTLKLKSRLNSMRQVLEVEQALGIFDRLLQIFGGSTGFDRMFTPAMLSEAARTLPQSGSAGVMLMQMLNTSDLDHDGNVSRSDWANYFTQVGIPTNTLQELEQGTFDIWRKQYTLGAPAVVPAAAQSPPFVSGAGAAMSSAATTRVGSNPAPGPSTCSSPCSAPTAMVLSEQGGSARRADLFDLIDRNRDGQITRQELGTAMFPGEPTLTTIVGGPSFGGDRLAQAPRTSLVGEALAEGPRIVPRG